MTTVYITTVIQSPGTGVVMGTTVGLKQVVLSTGFVGATEAGYSAFTGSGANQGVTILGTAVADAQAVINLSGANASVKVGSTGHVIGLEPENDGSSSFAIYLGSGGAVENAGTVIGQSGIALDGGGLLQNSGTIDATTYGVFCSNTLRLSNSGVINSIDGSGVYITGTLTMDNTGQINGGIYAYVGTIHNAGAIGGPINIASTASIWNDGTIGGDVNFGANYADHPLTWDLVNTGIISGDITTVTGVNAQINTLNVQNSGTITGSVAGLSSADRVVNSGTLHDVNMGGGADKLVNLNLLDGTVDFGGGTDADVLRNSGTITENVLGFGSLGATIRNAGQIEGSLTGSTGVDLLTNSGSIASIALGGGNDVLTFTGNGNSGSVVHADAGNDVLQGARADDNFSGDAGDDILRGGGGDDSLAGGGGGDKLFGGSGEDVLTGGLGKDELTGGSGADVFVFSSVAGTSKPGAFDIIHDFSTGEDLIDLSGNGLDFASFLGKAAFVNNGHAQLRYVGDGVGGLNIQIDTNGNTTIDAVIHLDGVTTLTRGDFLF